MAKKMFFNILFFVFLFLTAVPTLAQETVLCSDVDPVADLDLYTACRDLNATEIISFREHGTSGPLFNDSASGGAVNNIIVPEGYQLYALDNDRGTWLSNNQVIPLTGDGKSTLLGGPGSYNVSWTDSGAVAVVRLPAPVCTNCTPQPQDQCPTIKGFQEDTSECPPIVIDPPSPPSTCEPEMVCPEPSAFQCVFTHDGVALDQPIYMTASRFGTQVFAELKSSIFVEGHGELNQGPYRQFDFLVPQTVPLNDWLWQIFEAYQIIGGQKTTLFWFIPVGGVVHDRGTNWDNSGKCLMFTEQPTEEGANALYPTLDIDAYSQECEVVLTSPVRP